MNKIKLIIAAILVFAVNTRAQDSLSLSIDQCRTMALENSRIVKIADENINKARAEKKVAFSAWFPNVSASATGVYKNLELNEEIYMPTQVFDPMTGELVPNIAINPINGQPIIGPDGNPVFNTYAYLPIDITLNGGYMLGVQAQQPLYAGGKIIAGNKMAGIGESMAFENKELQTSSLINEADNSYYTYLSVIEKVKLAEKYKELLSGLVAMVEDSYNAGMINRNELLKVKVRYNEVCLEAQKAASGLELTRMALCRVIGVDYNTQIKVEDYMVDISLNVAELSIKLANERIEYKLLQKQVEMAEQNVKLVRGDYLPTAGVSLGYNSFNVVMEDADNYDSNGFNALFSIKIPITGFGDRAGKIRSAKSDLNIRQLELEHAEGLLQLELEQARLSLIDSYMGLNFTKEAMEQANENLRISRDSYNLGMETLVNLLEAQATWQNAHSSRIDAITEFRIKESNYAKLSGE